LAAFFTLGLADFATLGLAPFAFLGFMAFAILGLAAFTAFFVLGIFSLLKARSCAIQIKYTHTTARVPPYSPRVHRFTLA
jgi:hypothetical protein